ncbi:MAG: ATP-binding cassette domain-containing protein, partial [Betaproteobacteria bacterium]
MIHVQQLRKRFVQGGGLPRLPGLGALGAWGAAKARVVQAVDGVDFSAPDGRITGLLGPNGAGKTTTLRMIAALLVPDEGRITVDGIDVGQDPRAALARLGVLSDARGLYPRLSALENIVYYGRLHGMTAAAAAA